MKKILNHEQNSFHWMMITVQSIFGPGMQDTNVFYINTVRPAPSHAFYAKLMSNSSICQ